MNSKNETRRTRLAFDYQVVMEMAHRSRIIDVRAFANRNDLAKRSRPIRPISQGGIAGHYLAHYDVKSLVGPGKYHTSFDVVFDLITHKSYPKERDDEAIAAGGIVATCVSRPMPWSPHFLGSSGTICLESTWQGAQHTLLISLHPGEVTIHAFRGPTANDFVIPTPYQIAGSLGRSNHQTQYRLSRPHRQHLTFMRRHTKPACWTESRGH